MNVLYEENGAFKVGAVLAESDTSLQVEAPHGKRSKVKANAVLLRFEQPALAEFMALAEANAADIDTGFLWECCGEEEFGFAALAKDYCGHAPTPLEAAAILIKLHAAPAYFYRKGKGNYRAAPADILKSALAAIEKKRVQAEQAAEWTAQLTRFEMPEAFKPLLSELLYKPDRGRIETKALEEACAQTGLSTAKLFERCGALSSSHDFHLGRFLFEYFPKGAEFSGKADFSQPADLPHADVRAFSLDDATTTEIDDAFSLTQLPGGLLRVGVHIAAPALGIRPDSILGRSARDRLSTAYMPGLKITMLPDAAVDAFTLAAGHSRPAVSLYLDCDPETFAIVAESSRIESVPIVANLRHQQVQSLDDAFESGAAAPDIAFAEELRWLWQLAKKLEEARGKAGNVQDRLEYNFYVEADRVSIEARRRGAPLDKLVAELMIVANHRWGKMLDENGVAAIYRAQGGGKVRMTTSALPHEGLGVSHYAWSSSPLRRYIDLVNQWQLTALLSGQAPPFAANDADLLAVLRDFEMTYAAYNEFQNSMEHYWCLRWLRQQALAETGAELLRDNLVRLERIPFVTRVPSIPELPAGSRVVLEVGEIDFIDATVKLVYKGLAETDQAETTA
jgi:exoribonuclease-2